MSSFSFIFFPRKLENNGILASNKIFTSDYLRISGLLPFKEAKIFETLSFDEIKTIAKLPLISDTYLNILLNERFSKLYIFDDVNEKFSFTKDSKLQYAYRLEGNFDESRSAKWYEDDLRILKTKDAVNHLYVVTKIQDMVDRNLLYDLINENINCGEYVEIYTQWIDMDDPVIWGPPDKTFNIYLEDVLNNRKFYLTTNSNDRYIIHKP